MKTKFLGLLMFALVNLFSFSPLFVSALQCPQPPPGAEGLDWAQRENPSGLCYIDPGRGAPRSLTDAIIRVINIMLGLAFIIAVFFVIYGGYLFIFSAGNTDRVKQGKNTLFYAALGIAVIILAFIIVQLVSITTSSFGSGSVGP